ncbi:hypothetical protein NC797_00185 [Aquibacillus sp. 3ASR75-11]|uniref:Uncharacterized protein n=1 Tax=Terrihalobacillus insolitus TaxID=2950438 RepID=A0A9X3WMS1_9BACI|nr:hypothetical protein [Terrihalobacillus insolitus]MDC3412385.1 hypothetical protein [Terrihalobacillus insolitus]MDC3422922.1 hypothetical protein [Terrihalobacillus insolitus]
MMDFLYFPEDKTEYIPAVLNLLLFVLGAVIVMYFFYKHSKKEEKKIDEQYSHSEKTEKEDQFR